MTSLSTLPDLSLTNPLPFGKDVEVFFDGACPLCLREINLLRRRDKLKRIEFTDLSAAEFNPAPLGLTMEELLAAIHGRLPDGTIISGVEVFRRMYGAIGFGWLAAITRWPGVRQAADAAYWLFARNRMRFTGRCRDGQCDVRRTPEQSESPVIR